MSVGGEGQIDLTNSVERPNGARTLASAVYNQVRADVIACRYQPGEKLMIVPLAQRFSVSVASVREALSRLVADGLVVAEDQRGFRVSPLSLADLRDVTETRVELECLALRRSMLIGDPAWRERVAQAFQALDAVPHMPSGGFEPAHHAVWSKLHGRFHTALVMGCGLDWLLKFRAILYEQSERYRRLEAKLTGPGMGAQRDTRAEHHRLHEAVMAGDPEGAVAALTDHFRTTSRFIAEGYAGRGPFETLSSETKKREESK